MLWVWSPDNFASYCKSIYWNFKRRYRSKSKNYFIESNEIRRRILKKETTDKIKNILIHTVNNGTGKLAKVKDGVVGGKTGTSFISNSKDMMKIYKCSICRIHRKK